MKTVWAFISHLIISIIFILCLVNSAVENKKLQKSFEEIFGDGWHLKEMGEEGEEKEKEEEANLAKTMAQANDRHNRKRHTNQPMIIGEGSTTNDQEGENDENDQQQMEIICKFRAIREKIKERKGSKYLRERRYKIEQDIAKKLGTGRYKIYKWITELGMGHKMANKQRMAIMRQYWEMKRNNPKISDKKIVKALKTSERSITRWKGQCRELGMEMKCQLNVRTNDGQKRKIVREFKAIKERIKQIWKYSHKQWVKLEVLLAQKLGTNRAYIYEWIKELGMGQRKMQTTDEKLALMRKYWEMKRKDPKMSDAKIAQALKISERSIRNWKGQFREGEREEKDAF